MERKRLIVEAEQHVVEAALAWERRESLPAIKELRSACVAIVVLREASMYGTVVALADAELRCEEMRNALGAVCDAIRSLARQLGWAWNCQPDQVWKQVRDAEASLATALRASCE